MSSQLRLNLIYISLSLVFHVSSQQEFCYCRFYHPTITLVHSFLDPSYLTDWHMIMVVLLFVTTFQLPEKF